jgi:hypothetical protein
MANPDPHSLLDRLLDPVSKCLSTEGARRLIDLRAEPAVQQRVDELADRCTEGTLTADEAREYDIYLNASTFIGILQAKASRILERPTAA